MEGLWDPSQTFFNAPSTPVAPAPVATPAPVVTPAPVAAPAPAPVYQAPAPVAAPAPVYQAPVFTQTVPLADDDYSSLVKTVKVGEAAKRPIDQFKGTTAKIKRMSFLTLEWLQVSIHYIPGVGKVYCWGGSCCEADPKGQAPIRYVAPVLYYKQADNGGNLMRDNQGNVIFSPESFEVQFLVMAGSKNPNKPSTYDSVCLINEQIPVDSIDLKVLCSNEQYQNLSFVQAGPATWKQNEQFVRLVAQEYQAKKQFILRECANKLGRTPAEMEQNLRTKLDQARQRAANGQGQNQGYAGHTQGYQQAPQGYQQGQNQGYQQAPQTPTTPSSVNGNFDINKYMNQ